MLATEHLDEKLYGSNKHELDTLRLIRHQLNLSEISECDDSTDTETISLTRVQEITAKEIARFDYLTQVKSASSGASVPPVKKPRVKSPSVGNESSGIVTIRSKTGSSASFHKNTLALSIPSSICDGSSSEISPFSKEGSEDLSVDLKELTKTYQKSDTELCRIHVRPRFLRSERNRTKQSPKILDLQLLSSIRTEEPSPNYLSAGFKTKSFSREAKITEWSDSTSTAVEECSTGLVSPETERLFTNDYHLLCTGLDVPLLCKPKGCFPAITKITTNIGTLNEPSTHDFQCIYDAGYGDVKLDSSKDDSDVAFDDDYVTYKDVAGDMIKDTSKATPSKITPELPAVEALLFREAQSTELPFYDIASTSPSSEGEQSITLVSESEDTQKMNSFWSKCFCCDFLKKLEL